MVTALVMVSELFSLLVVPVLAPYLGPVHVASLYSSEHDLPPDLDMTAERSQLASCSDFLLADLASLNQPVQ